MVEMRTILTKAYKVDFI